MAPLTVAATAPFNVFCKLLDKLTASKAAERRSILQKYVDVWRKTHEEMHGTEKTEDSFYPAMRLLLPGFDKERGPYGFKENMLAKKLTAILMMDKHGSDASRLLNYRAPGGAKSRGTLGDLTGDFAAVACDVLKHRVSKSGDSLTLEEVNRRLDAIAVANATKNKAAIDEELEWLCRKVDAVELKWLIRILLKQMKIGMQENTVLGVFHTEAPQLYDVTTSLKRVCEQLHDPNTRLDVIQIQLFVPFRPMLANRTAPEKVEGIMSGREFFIEEKYDGERMQLHKRGDEYKYFSRNANDFTSSYGASSKEGSFTPYICKAFKSTVNNCILDGEMVGWNPDGKCVATKGEQFDVKSLRDGDSIHPCFVAFDCVMINDQVLTQKPLQERLEVLRNHFTEIEGRFMFAKQELKCTTQDVVDAMNWAIERREEGIVIKRPDSTYKLNVRTNEGGWLKIKPDYLDAINDDLDLLIIGGYFGEGRRSKLMSHFLLGLAVPPSDPSEKPKKFISVAKVGSGYTMIELYHLNGHLTKNPLRRNAPDWCQVGAERPDVYIDPEFSKIVQIRAAEIYVGKNFAAGYTLRFPRVQKIRDDKDWFEAMTVDEFHKMRTECEGRLAAKYELATEGPSPSKKRRFGAAAQHAIAARPELGSQFRAADVRKVQKISDVFKGKELCITGDCDEYSKCDLEKKVAEFGGKLIQYPRTKTFCAVAEKESARITNMIGGKLTNVVKTTWLVECIRRNALIPWKPSDMLYATPKVKDDFARNFDEFGDSYTQPITSVEEMRAILDRVKPKAIDGEKEDIFDEFVLDYLPHYEYGIFRRCRSYFDYYQVIEDKETKITDLSLDLTCAEYLLYGGRVVESLDTCTHVIVHSRDRSRLAQLMERNRSKARKFHIVTQDWVNACIGEKALLDEVRYQPLL